MTNPVEHIRDELEGAGDVIRLAEGQLYTVKARKAGEFAAEATKAMEECDTLEQLCGVCSNVVKAEKVIGLNVSRRVHQTALREAVRLVLAAMPGTFWAMVEPIGFKPPRPDDDRIVGVLAGLVDATSFLDDRTRSGWSDASAIFDVLITLKPNPDDDGIAMAGKSLELLAGTSRNRNYQAEVNESLSKSDAARLIAKGTAVFLSKCIPRSPRGDPTMTKVYARCERSAWKKRSADTLESETSAKRASKEE